MRIGFAGSLVTGAVLFGGCLLLSTSLHAGAGIESPVREPSAPATPIKFYADGKPQFSTGITGKAKPALAPVKVSGTVVDEGISVRMEATGLRGGHGARLTWKIPEAAQDWSDKEGVEFWFRAPKDSVLDYV
ncbi:MAG: hypothetical protein WAX69_17015, partial [Victivallales bacterium]